MVDESSPFIPLYPSLQFVLIVVFLSSYCIFGAFVIAQLSLTCYLRNKILSYHTIFLTLGLVWTLLRITLFALLLRVEIKYPLADWPLRCGPVVLNFVMLSLFTMCFIQVLLDSSRSISLASGINSTSRDYKKMIYITWILLLVLFLGINITSFILQMIYKRRLYAVIQISLQEGCMTLCCIGLAVTLYFVYRGGPVVHGKIEREGKSLGQVMGSGAVIISLYITHSMYCLYIAATDCYNTDREVYVNDMVLNNTLSKRSLAPISIALMIWDFVPVIAMLNFFKTKTRYNTPIQPGLSYTESQQYFFDDPKRYEEDSDDSLPLCDNSEYSASPTVIHYGSLDNGIERYYSPTLHSPYSVS